MYSFKTEDPDTVCEQRRFLTGDDLVLNAVLSCSGRDMGDRYLYLSKVVNKEDQLVEVVAYVSTTAALWQTASRENAELIESLEFVKK